MTKTHASATTPSKGSATPHTADNYAANPSGIVVGLTVSMSWQLAIVVLVPVFGGHLLDAHFRPKGAPYFTLAGLLVAIAGMIVIVRRTLKELNKYMSKPTEDGETND